MSKAVFVLSENANKNEVISQLSNMNTFGDEILVIEKSNFSKSRFDGWIIIEDVKSDKEFALILDHSSTHKNLGFVTDIYHETLDEGKIKKKAESKPKEKLPKECSNCGYLKAPKVWICPECGYKPEKQTDVEVVEGELLEVIRNNLTIVEKNQFYGELKYIARERGYKSGWVDHKYREKTGVWAVPEVKSSIVRYPKPETERWVKHTMIKWAKSREANG